MENRVLIEETLENRLRLGRGVVIEREKGVVPPGKGVNREVYHSGQLVPRGVCPSLSTSQNSDASMVK